MTGTPTLVELDPNVAQPWLLRSLEQGHSIATEVLANEHFRNGRFRTWVDTHLATLPPSRLDHGGVQTTPGLKAAMAPALDDLARRHGSCVVIEDNLRLRRHPHVIERHVPTAFLGERVIHWCDLHSGDSAEVVLALYDGSNGYPLNAFVTSLSASELRLVHGADVPADVPRVVAQSLCAVIVAAYDAESFLLWDRG